MKYKVLVMLFLLFHPMGLAKVLIRLPVSAVKAGIDGYSEGVEMFKYSFGKRIRGGGDGKG